MSLHELILGGLPLDGLTSVMSDEGWLLRVKSAASGTVFGTSEAVVSAVDTMGADGGQARIDGYANATSTLQVQILGVDATALAKGEAALRRVLPDGHGSPVDLLWRPSDGMAPASVRVVLTGVLGSPSTSSEWDRDEVRLTRTFPLVLTHLPHVRSEFPTVTEALSEASGTATSIRLDDASDATGWSALIPGAFADVVAHADGGETVLLATHPATATRMRIHMYGPAAEVVDFTQLPYLVVEACLPGTDREVTWSAGGQQIAPIRTRATSGGYVQYFFPTAGVLIPQSIELRFLQTVASGSGIVKLRPVDLTNRLTETAKQSSRLLPVGGTERSAGTLTVSSRDANPLGLTLVHTAPNGGTGYDPDLNRWVIAGSAQVDDDDAPMGGWRELSVGGLGLVAGVPQHAFPQRSDTYQIGAIVRSATIQQVTLSWTVLSVSAGSPVVVTREERVVSVNTAMTWVPLGRSTLPASRARRGTSMISLELTDGDPVNIGGWYAFRAGRDSALTVVDSPDPHLHIQAGEGSDPGSWMIGAEPDGSDAYTPIERLKMPGVHVLRPGLVDTYVITADTDDPAMSYSHYRNWTANAADDGTTP